MSKVIRPAPTPRIDLRADAEAVMLGLRGTLRPILNGLPGGPTSPTELASMLGLHKTLCWRVLQVAHAREPLAAAQHIPGDDGLEKFLGAAGRQGVRQAKLNAVRTAAARYRALMRTHAGDRASFEVMLQSLASSDESAVELKAARRAGHRAASYTWGIQIAARILTAIVTPVGADRVDIATIRAHVRARRVRRDGTLRLSRTVEHASNDPRGKRAAVMPIEPESVVGGVPLLPAFCTRPLPQLKAVARPGENTVEYCLTDQPLGEQSAITVFTGEVRRGLSGARWRADGDATNNLMLTVRDPMGLAVIDLWAPPGLAQRHGALTVSATGVDPLAQHPDEWQLLPAAVAVAHLGRGVPAARIAEVPEYEDAVAHVFARLQWAPEGYELHRVQLDYPLVGTCLVLQSILPERPQGADALARKPD